MEFSSLVEIVNGRRLESQNRGPDPDLSFRTFIRIRSNNRKFYLITIFPVLLFCVGCGVAPIKSINNGSGNNLVRHANAPLRIPNGDEVKVNVKILKAKRALMIVENKSDDDVFIPYLPGINSEYSDIVVLGLEKFDSETSNYTPIEEADFGPGLRPLHSGKSFKYIFSVPKSGTYKINLRYSVDKGLAERIEKAATLEKGSDEWRAEYAAIDEMIKNAVKTVPLGPFKL